MRFNKKKEEKNDFPGTRLFFASFATLFVELALIRFIPAHVRVIAYFTNIVLIASFFGLGIGFLLARRKYRLEKLALPLLLITVLVVRVFSNVIVLNIKDSSEPLWLFYRNKQPSSIELPITVVVLIFFIVVALTMVPIGQVMGRLFGRFARLKAYTLDLGGSLIGILFFGFLSALRSGPWLWFSISAVIILIALCQTHFERLIGLASFGLIFWTLLSMTSPGQIWSPYYKVNILHESHDQTTILTNGCLHQVMLDFTSDLDYIKKTKKRFEIPYRLAKKLDDVLIVGSGSGNDVAIANIMEAKSIDAVEIDPVFPEIGKKYHPQFPYNSENVHLHITDARAYFKRCTKKYDLIIFGTLDSQSLLGGLSTIRLDNYIYTKEAFKEVYALLKPNGLIALFHMSPAKYIGDKIFLLLFKATGRIPLYMHFDDHTLFNTLFILDKNISPQPPRHEYMEHLKSIKLPTDDWPFLYLRSSGIPSHYIQVLLGIIIISLLSGGAFIIKRLSKFNFPLFFLGAGFLLLETKSITQMSLLFGSTWIVNLLVFSSIICILFITNIFIIHLDKKGISLNLNYLFGILAALLVALAVIPIDWIAGLPQFLRWLTGGLLVALPIGLAGLIFPTIFKKTDDPMVAFGSNLLGAIAGGIFEYFTMLLGISSLTMIAAVFYLIAFRFYIRRTGVRLI